MILDTLITDRTAVDVARVKALSQKGFAAMTAEEQAEYLQPMKGAYNATDLNRVQEACEYIANRLHQYGYAVDVQKIPHQRGGQSRLPEGYTELVSIQSTGTQYIDTGFTPNQDTRVVADLIFPANGLQLAFGALNQIGQTYRLFELQAVNGIYRNDYGSQYPNAQSSVSTRYVVDKNKNVQTLNGISHSATYETFSCDYPMFVFGQNRQGTVDGLATMTLYSMQIYDNGSLVRDFVPCINPQNAVGLYDLVTEQFFGNAGTGNFVAGAAVVELPDGYTQLEYIQSSGTQYIDTGFTPNQNTRVIAEFEADDCQGDYRCAFGARYDVNNSNSFAFYLTWSNTFVAIYGASSLNDFSIARAGRHTIDWNKNSIKLDSATLTPSAQTFNSGCNMCICAANSAQGQIMNYFLGRIYAFQIYDNGTLVRDFVPCINDVNAVGLYDIVNGVFYGNNGSGVFTGGSEIAPPAPPPVTDYEWIMSDIPTPVEMEIYIANIQRLRDVFAIIAPQAPTDAEEMTYTEANNIETILIAVDALLNRVIQSFVFSGQVYSGMVWEEFTNV